MKYIYSLQIFPLPFTTVYEKMIICLILGEDTECSHCGVLTFILGVEYMLIDREEEHCTNIGGQKRLFQQNALRKILGIGENRTWNEGSTVVADATIPEMLYYTQ